MQYYGFFLFVCIIFLFCQAPTDKKEVLLLEEQMTTPLQIPVNPPKYSWKESNDLEASLAAQIKPPLGARRIKVETASFGEWLRFLPLKEKGAPVHYYNGGTKFGNVHHRVVDIDTGKRDLQQCADAVMRLKSEYHYSRGEAQAIAFNFTNGTQVKYSDWRQGKKPIIKGNKVSFSAGSNHINGSYANFKKYMNIIFSYAGTASLSKEMKAIDLEEMRIGDVFIQGGFPGHAVIVVDMAVAKNGSKYFLLAQSYMPAQDIHVLKNPNDSGLSPWYPLDFKGALSTPEWTFEQSDLKRFR